MGSDSKLNRRLLLQYSGQALLAYEALTLLPMEAQARVHSSNLDLVTREGFSVLQGVTTETSTQLTVDVPDNMKTQYRLVDAETGKVLEPSWSDRQSREYSSWAVDKIYFKDLQVGHLYLFHVMDPKGRVLDERELQALDRSQTEARIAVGSCMLDVLWARYDMWKNVAKTQPDMMFFLGDNVYGDIMGLKPGPKQLWRRYIETRRRIPFYHSRKLIPSLALWDDHDYGKNDQNGSYKHKHDSLKTFNAFFAQENIDGSIERGPGISSAFRAFGHDFIFGDCRFFRDSMEGDTKCLWGAEQLAWVEKILNRNSGPAWIMQGSQFFGYKKVKGPTYEKTYAGEFAKFAQMIKNSNRKATFFSGDIHLTEVMEIEPAVLGYVANEITSSAMHSMRPFSRPENHRRLDWNIGYNHMLMDIVTSGGEASYQAISVGRDGKTKFNLDL